MNNEPKTMNCFTLVEMLIVVGITALLAAIAISVAARIDNKAKQQLAESNIAILTAALQQFADFGYNYKDADYREFDFPLDCNGFPVQDLEDTLEYALLDTGNVSIDGGDHDQSYSGCEAMYFFLSRVPACRQILDKIDKSLITNRDEDGNRMIINVDGDEYPLLRIIDPWGKTLRYDYYDESFTDPYDWGKTKRTFPVITSAGPDRIFDTDDDITNR